VAKQKILVIDDHRTVGMLMESVLKLRGFQVLHAEEGAAGLELARRELPALIFLDIMMPEMDGFRVCKQLKQDPTTSAIPVIFLSSFGEAVAVERGKAAGGDGFLKKPFKSDEVIGFCSGV
jgi:cyclic di-GMP phosphodiesterase